VQEPGIKATGAQGDSPAVAHSSEFEDAADTGIGGIIQSQNITTSNVKFDSPPQVSAQKGFQS